MSDVKWIKLSTALPDNRKMKAIRSMPDGDSIALLWVYILCLAGDTNDHGYIYLTEDIPFTEEMLANQFDFDVSLVRTALGIFERFGMIDIVDDFIRVSSWEEHQSSDRLEEMRENTRKRVTAYRERKALSGGNAESNAVCNAESNAACNAEENAASNAVSNTACNAEGNAGCNVTCNAECNVTSNAAVTLRNAIDKNREEREKSRGDKHKKVDRATLPEIEAYVAERGLSVDPKEFFDYFEAGDWHDSKGNPVRSWKQKITTWDMKRTGDAGGRKESDWERLGRSLGVAI